MHRQYSQETLPAVATLTPFHHNTYLDAYHVEVVERLPGCSSHTPTLPKRRVHLLPQRLQLLPVVTLAKDLHLLVGQAGVLSQHKTDTTNTTMLCVASLTYII